MGYTHYYKISIEKYKADETANRAYRNARIEINQLAEFAQTKGIVDLDIKETGKMKTDTMFNGIEEENQDHEDFYLPYLLNMTDTHWTYSGFCKTARKPYDIVVTAALFVLKKHLQGAVKIDSDGYNNDKAYPKYCDDEIKAGFKLYKKFQKECASIPAMDIPMTYYFK